MSKYINEVYRVLKREGMFICVSHDDKRHTQYLKTAGIDWEAIEIVKVYKPTLERESELIKQEFIHRSVTDKIEDLKRVQTEILEEDTPPVIVPYDKMEPFVPKQREPPVLKAKGDDPAQVACYYIYICKKPFIKTPEPSLHEQEDKENLEEDDFINPNSRY